MKLAIMNFLTDLPLTSIPKELGYVIIALILLSTITDIPLFIYNFFVPFFKLIGLKADSTTENLKTPSNRRKIPITALLEKKLICTHQKICDTYLQPLLSYKQKNVSWFINRQSDNDETEEYIPHFEKFDSREIEHLFDKTTFTVICGLPGTGKSSVVFDFLNKELKGDSIDFLVYFNITEIKTTAPALLEGISDNSFELLWKNVLYAVNRFSSNVKHRPSPNLISYFINYGKCYFILDDCDDRQHIHNLMELFNNYLDIYHKHNKNFKIIITTRAQQVKTEQRIITLKPLNISEAEAFFYNLANRLHIKLNTQDFFDIVEGGKSLLSFRNKYTQNPLFIEIVIYIIKERGFRNLKDIFQKSVATVYREFIKTLSTKGNQISYDKFYPKFCLLGYLAAARNLIEFEFNLIEESFAGYNEVDIEFLHTNGLLIRRNIGGKNWYSFIHLTIRDVLYIDYIVSQSKFDIFANVNYLGEEFIYYLREEIRHTNQYWELAKHNIRLAINVQNADFIKKISNNSLLSFQIQIIGNALQHFVFDKDDKTEPKEIVQFIKSVPGWEKYLDQCLLEIVQKQSFIIHHAASILLQLKPTLISAFLFEQVKEGKYHKNVAGLINEQNLVITRMFSQIMETPTFTPDMLTLWSFLLSSKISPNSTYAKWFLKNLHIIPDSFLNSLLIDSHIVNNIVLPNYENTSVEKSIALNHALRNHIWGWVFVPKGSYSRSNASLYNHWSFLVKIQPNILLITAKDHYAAEMKSLQSIAKQLMSFEQLDIAYRFFSKSDTDFFNPHAIIGLGSSLTRGISYEAYKENNKGKLFFAHIPSKNTSISKQIDTGNFKQNVIYHEFKHL
ncbi:hypothetical protein ADIARSV_0413 [Arcticibacter svalbardensis MN12-7]|uniref:NACHT domain-containing protein n=1 Tax=Arcticibacter svalbardensis MN12-7 TaxID=1150600 RepID=R9GXL0_9SPHI|nr:hypothetical protein [Arcticibacter svalbardensis]EOR96413.1 hypothetical protein ADIARSV_0413 [Arcticibacter svalbardensis MN12-7]